MENLAERIGLAASENDAVFKLLNMQLLSMSEGKSSIAMAITADMLNGFAIGHGGITFTLADTAFAFACNSRNVLTVAEAAEIKFLKKVQLGDVLTASAAERQLEGKKGIYDVVVTNQDGETVATFTGYSHGMSRPLIET